MKCNLKIQLKHNLIVLIHHIKQFVILHWTGNPKQLFDPSWIFTQEVVTLVHNIFITNVHVNQQRPNIRLKVLVGHYVTLIVYMLTIIVVASFDFCSYILRCDGMCTSNVNRLNGHFITMLHVRGTNDKCLISVIFQIKIQALMRIYC